MRQSIFWTSLAKSGLENLCLIENESGVLADGVVLSIFDDEPARCTYQIRCDSSWYVREVLIERQTQKKSTVSLTSDGSGNWFDGEGAPLPMLSGCLDIDISATPFTNTLPVRRLNLQVGQAADVNVVYFSIPELSFQPSLQRYTFLQRMPGGMIYRFEENGIDAGFQAEVNLDEKCLVLNYPGLFRRL